MIVISGTLRDRLDAVLCSWEGTPRMAGQRAKNIGTDCAGFIAGIMEEMVGGRLDSPPLLDAFQVRCTAEKAFRKYLGAFPADVLDGDVVEPGDVLLVGRRGMGMEHVLFAGNTYLWHCNHVGVAKTGGTLQGGMSVKKILRYRDKGDW